MIIRRQESDSDPLAAAIMWLLALLLYDSSIINPPYTEGIMTTQALLPRLDDRWLLSATRCGCLDNDLLSGMGSAATR